MLRLIVIGLLSVAICFPAAVCASEDTDPFMFGDEVPVDVVATTPLEPPAWHEESASALQTSLPPADEFAPPPADALPPEEPALEIPEQVPDIPLFQPPAQEAKTAPKVPQSQSEPQPSINTNQALTDTLRQETDVSKPPLPLADVDETWVGKLASGNPLALLGGKDAAETDNSLEKLVSDARSPAANANRRSNASVFDISGVMLRMSLKQVETTMQNRGFRKIMQKYQIPNFIKWRNEEYCRNTGVVGYERIESCITQKAKKDNHQYVQTAKYAKYDTKEEIEVTFSSNFTDNKVIKIVYKSQAANIKGNSPKAVYLRNIKVYDFWKKINQKYGKPDDKDNVTWGMGGDKPFLKASTGYLKLEDPMLRELDYTRMSREDQRYMNTDLYSF